MMLLLSNSSASDAYAYVDADIDWYDATDGDVVGSGLRHCWRVRWFWGGDGESGTYDDAHDDDDGDAVVDDDDDAGEGERR